MSFQHIMSNLDFLNPTHFEPILNRNKIRYSGNDKKQVHDESIKESEPQWADKTDINRMPFGFTGPEPGPVYEATNELEIFELFFTNEIVDNMLQKINRYYESDTHKEQRKKSRAVKPTTFDELWIWIATLILIGFSSRAHYADNWSRDPLICNSIIGETIEKFDLILSCCIFGFDEEEDINDNLGGIRSFFTHFNAQFQRYYNLKREIFIDKRLIIWKGQRPKKGTISDEIYWEFRIYPLIEPETGYIWNILPDEHRNTKLLSFPEIKELFMPGRALMTLVSPILNRGHLLACDIFYTDIVMFRKLVEAKTDCIGAVSDNRRCLPRAILQKEWEEDTFGKSVFGYSEKFCVLNYKGREEIQIVSSVGSPSHFYSGEAPEIVSFYEKLSKSSEIKSPRIFGSDTANLKLVHFHKKAMFFFVKIALSNAYVISQQTPGLKKQTYYQFLSEVARAIIAKHSVRSSLSITTNPPDWIRLTASHVRIDIYKRQCKCTVCTKAGTKTKVWRGCLDCGVALCIDDCFELFHSVIDYAKAKKERLLKITETVALNSIE